MATEKSAGNKSPAATPAPAAADETPAQKAARESNAVASGSTISGDQNLVIPKLGSTASDVLGDGGPVAQDGEDTEALQAQHDPAAMAFALTGSSRALERPAIPSATREVVQSEAPMKVLQLSDIDRKLEELRRNDLQLEAVTDLALFADHAQHLKFNEEHVIINIHESNDPTAEDPVPLRVNGTTVTVKRGVDMIVRRKYVELLMRMKPQNVVTRIDRSDPDNIKNLIEKRSQLLIPFNLVRDDNPKSRAWVKRVMSEH